MLRVCLAENFTPGKSSFWTSPAESILEKDEIKQLNSSSPTTTTNLEHAFTQERQQQIGKDFLDILPLSIWNDQLHIELLFDKNIKTQDPKFVVLRASYRYIREKNSREKLCLDDNDDEQEQVLRSPRRQNVAKIVKEGWTYQSALVDKHLHCFDMSAPFAGYTMSIENFLSGQCTDFILNVILDFEGDETTTTTTKEIPCTKLKWIVKENRRYDYHLGKGVVGSYGFLGGWTGEGHAWGWPPRGEFGPGMMDPKNCSYSRVLWMSEQQQEQKKDKNDNEMKKVTKKQQTEQKKVKKPKKEKDGGSAKKKEKTTKTQVRKTKK